ncbi:antibiotic biosynthesis monooxygenase family protein [Dermabacteraceae bacterium P13136]
MSIVVTNQITLPAENADVIIERFKANGAKMECLDGYEGFRVCKPTDPADGRWIVITYWRDEDAYAAWRESRKYMDQHEKDVRKKLLEGTNTNSEVRHYEVMVDTTPGKK